MNENAGLYAYCAVCGNPIGTFADKGELIREIVKRNECTGENCHMKFVFENGNVRGIKIDFIPSKEEYLVELLGEVIEKEDQLIYCYEDKGPDVKTNRYPQKLLRFYKHDRTGRATLAYAAWFLNKDSNDIEKSYVFDNPNALLQVAREAIKGIHWIKYQE
ncbi:MAG: hypothetical protein ACFFD4_24300 [Candidatus Odinarchaeota archaeon]